MRACIVPFPDADEKPTGWSESHKVLPVPRKGTEYVTTFNSVDYSATLKKTLESLGRISDMCQIKKTMQVTVYSLVFEADPG